MTHSKYTGQGEREIKTQIAMLQDKKQKKRKQWMLWEKNARTIKENRLPQLEREYTELDIKANALNAQIGFKFRMDQVRGR